MRSWVVSIFIFLMILVPLQAQSADPDLSVILVRARERVDHFYHELQHVAWTDTIRQQALNDNRTPKDKPREVAYDMIVRLEIAKDEDPIAPFYVRDESQLIRVDGRAATANDSSSSTNTNPAILSVLHPLLAKGEFATTFHFAYVERTGLNGRQSHVISFNRDDAQHYSGRIWIDAETYDVLKIDWKVRLPVNHARFVRYFEVMANLRPIAFEDPKQTILAFDSMTIVSIRNGTLFQEIHTLGNYKRFAGNVTIVPVENPNPRTP